MLVVGWSCKQEQTTCSNCYAKNVDDAEVVVKKDHTSYGSKYCPIPTCNGVGNRKISEVVSASEEPHIPRMGDAA